MSNVIITYPKDNLIEVVADQLDSENRDFSNYIVVFPGRRPAHFLRKEIAHRLKQCYIPPRIFSIDDFIQELFESISKSKQRKLETIDAVYLLYRIHTELEEKIGDNHFATFDSFIPVGIKLYNEIEDLHLTMLTEKEIKENLANLAFSKLFTIPEYYRRFYKVLKEKGYSTRSLQYRYVAENIKDVTLSEYKEIILAGFYKYTKAEKTIMDWLSNLPNVKFIYQRDALEEVSQEPEFHFIKSPDTHGQVFALSAILDNEIKEKGKPDERSVIVMPSADTLFPVLHHTLTLLEREDYNIALGYPVTRTPLYGFLHNLLELVSTKENDYYSIPPYIKFVLHPYTKNIRYGNRTDVTRMLFHAIEIALTERSHKTLIKLEEIESLDEIFTSVAYIASEEEIVTAENLKEHLKNIHSNLICRLENIHTLNEFATSVNDIIDYIYTHSTAKLHPLFQPYAEALIQTFEQLSNSIAGGISFENIKGYFNFIRHYLASQTVPFPGTPLHGLQVLGLLETRGLRFENVYLLSANDHIIPGKSDDYALIPQAIREKLGMETIRQRNELSKYYFNLLINGAKRVFIFFEESERSEKSRFVEQLLWEKQKRDKVESINGYIETIRYNVKLTGNQIVPIPKSSKSLGIINGLTFSASALDTYLNCQLQFYYKYVLKLKEKEEISEEIEQKDIGTLVHKILKEFFEPLKDKELKRDYLNIEQLNSLIDNTFACEFGTQPNVSAYLLKRQIKRQLSNMLIHYQIPIIEKKKTTIKYLEKEITVGTSDTLFYGKLDRVEKRNGKIIILDYKTSSNQRKSIINFNKLDINDRESWSKAITSLQLPLYLLLYSLESKLDIQNISPAYLYLGNVNLNEKSEVYFIEDDLERAEKFGLIKTIIERLISEIRDASHPFLPPTDPYKSCRYCSFKELCGTKWIE